MIKPEIEEFLRLRGTQIGDYEHNEVRFTRHWCAAKALTRLNYFSNAKIITALRRIKRHSLRQL